ncbi:hypothetical protein [uncultured Thiodictyon sp.]|uniref:hypothetical protein n=1 Tax=uncultured Thiodictyon sp. TaxID=1846217 RepID=UPI0025F6012B|nr:hypothetical protein [uncultured Thiodictyon sp.]
MATEHRIVQTGNRIEIQFDGKVIGLLQNLRPSDDMGLEPASGVGDIHVSEYVPTMARHHLTASTMVLFSGNLRDAGIATENGDSALKGLVFDICVYGKDPKNTGLLRKYIKCSYASGDVEIAKHAIVGSNVQFMALDVVGTKL